MTPEQRAKLADLCHEIMAIVGDQDDAYAASVYDACEEWHDHYRWLDGTDVFDR